MKIELTETFLKKEYIDLGLTAIQIAQKYNLNKNTIRSKLFKFGIIRHKRRLNLIGHIFGKWTVTEKYGKNKRGSILWTCKCQCGNVNQVTSAHLQAGESKCCKECGGALKKDLTEYIGKTFNNWTVQKIIMKKGRQHFLCKCKCGKEKDYQPYFIVKNIRLSCEDCVGWDNHEGLCYGYFTAIQKRAIKKNREFSISIEYIVDLFKKQNAKCALTGLDICISNRYRSKSRPQTASLDRIDSSKGYIEENVQWVHKDVNYIKNDFSQEELIKYCNLIAKTHPRNV